MRQQLASLAMLAALTACGGGAGNQGASDPSTLPAAVLQVQALPSAIESSTNASPVAAKAVDLTDAIAILKMIVGLDVNTGGAALTAYQAYAADVDGNGKVELSDAISVLKRIVGLENASANWMFFNGTPTVADKLNPGLPPTVSAAVGNANNVSMTAVLRGDVVSSSTFTYSWALTSAPSGSTATLSSATAANPSFKADVVGAYVATMTITDGSSNVATSSVTLTACSASSNSSSPFSDCKSITSANANVAPVANAGTNQNVTTNSTVALTGALSSDANSDSLSYAWTITSRPATSSASLTNSSTVSPTFIADKAGNYVVSLFVNDGKVDSAAATVTITASTANIAPVANAGGGLNVYVGTTVTLNGTGSYDPNSDFLLYSWAFVSKPAGSSATLSGATTATPSFITDVAGSYVIALAVRDGSLGSQISTVTITATPVPVVSTVSFYLYGGAINSVYLGCLTCNQFHAESVCNSFGTYGSAFSSSSIWNQFGTYGSSFQSYSPWNSFSSSGPLIVGSNGLYYGYFTTNAFKANRTTTQPFLNILNFYSSTNNLATTRSYACGN